MGTALASGALWFAALDAVLLFRALPDPAQAGRLAADAFGASYVIAAVVTVTVVVCAVRGRMLASALFAICLTQLFLIVPALRSHGSGWPFSFASLHASASLLHVLLAAGSAWLSWSLTREQ